MTKREGEGSNTAAAFDLAEYGNRKSPSRNDQYDHEMDQENSPMKHGRFSLSGFGDGDDGCFQAYRDSRSAPSSTPGSTAGSRANSRPGSRPGSRMTSRCNSQESIIDLFDSMSLKFGSNGDGKSPFYLKSPKPKPLAFTKMPYIDRVRVNSAIWRSWHMQYIKKKKSPICHFSSPLNESNPRLVSDVIQGKTALTQYKPDQLGLVVSDYRKWRLYGKDIQKQLHIPSHVTDPEENAIDLDLPHPPLSPMSAGKLVNNDLFKDFADTLFISTKKKHFTVPAPKKVTSMFNYIPEVIQPGLSTLQPELDQDFISTFEFVESLLGRTPTKNDPRSLGIMEDLPSALLCSVGEAMNFHDTMDSQTDEQPEIVTPSKRDVVKQIFPVSLAMTNNQSPPLMQGRKVVSFSAPATPRQSKSQSPVLTPPPSFPYQILLQSEFDQNDSLQLGGQAQTLEEMSLGQFQNDVTMTTANSFMNQHPILLQTLANAPSLPSQYKTISTCQSTDVHSPRLSSGHSTPSPGGLSVQESKVECDSPLNQPSARCMETNLPGLAGTFITSTVGSNSIGSLTYQLDTSPSSMIPAISQEWNAQKVLNGMNWGHPFPGPTNSSAPVNNKQTSGQFFQQMMATSTNNQGSQNFTISANQVIDNSVPEQSYQNRGHVAEESMDYGQFVVKDGSSPRRSSGERSPSHEPRKFKQPMRDGNSRARKGSMQEVFKSPASYVDVHMHLQGDRKSNAGGHLSLLSPRDERETIPVPSSSHTSAASSAASSPGSAQDETLKEFEYNMYKAKRKSTPDQAEKAARRKRKHLDSEHKRRFNITSGLEELQRILPTVSVSSSKEQMKFSTAVLLQKTYEHIVTQKEEVEAMRTEKKKLKEEVQRLNDEIEKCQDSLPDTGAPVNPQNNSQLQQMLNKYLSISMNSNWKYWIFSKFVKTLFPSYTNAVDVSTTETLPGDVLNWFEETCRLRHLRSIALKSVTQVSKDTAILSDPSKFQEQVEDIIRHNRSRERDNLPEI